MTAVLGYSSTANAHSIGNSGVFYYARGTSDTGYKNASNCTITGLAINVSDWNAVTGLKVNMCDASGTSLRIAEFLPADGTGLIIKTVTTYNYTANAGVYFEILTTGGTGYVESYDDNSSFGCNSCLTGTYASPGNIAPGSDSGISANSPFVYADGSVSVSSMTPFRPFRTLTTLMSF